MSNKKLSAIIIACTIAIIVAIFLIYFKPWERTPSAEVYTLTIVVSPSGAGSVSPSGGEYESGVQVTLTARPASGYCFLNWTGDVDTIDDVNADTTTITMNDNYSITANFVAQYVLTIESAEGGEITNPGEGTSTYVQGRVVDLVAEAEEGWEFAEWTGDVGSIADINAPSTTITMNGNYTITADFALEIWNWYDLDAIRDNLGGSYLLMNGLDSTTDGYVELASETANEGRGWEPIGTSDDGFTGSFNGQGYEIRNLFINRPDQDYVGLFGHISWMHPIENVGVIQNVGLVNADVTGYYQVGALVGYNAGIVNNSYSTCSVTSEGWYVGGLVGYNDGGFVSDSYSIGNVTGNRYVGGLVGHITGARTVREGIVRNCYSTSNVTGFTRVGGLAGSILADVNMSNSYFAGSVTGKRWVGGLVAENYGGTVSNSYSTGSVTGDGYVGGLVGLNLWGTISSCYSTGMVSGDGPVGGLVGENSEGTVSNSFWDIQTSGQATSAGGTGKTMAEMQDIATFSGVVWNIIAVALGETNNAYTWNIVDQQTYPFLSWQPIS